MKYLIFISALFTSCSVSVIPLPEQAQYQKRQLPALFVNQDITGFEATPTSVKFDSLKSTEPINAQSKGVAELVRIRAFFGLAEKGVEAASTLGEDAINAIK